jgi:hypothetical protein
LLDRPFWLTCCCMNNVIGALMNSQFGND